MELGPRSKRTLGRGSTPRRGGMQRDIPHAKTLLAHPIVERLSLSRYWARLKPRSESLAWRGELYQGRLGCKIPRGQS